MFGVAVTMVISTMHEKSCIDLHNTREFEKSSEIPSFTRLSIAMTKLRNKFLKSSEPQGWIIQQVISYTTG